MNQEVSSLCWPSTNSPIPGTEEDVIRQRLENLRIDLAATPRPDLICRLPNCLRDGKPHPTLPFIESSSYIYLSDLDVSFVKVKCTEGCSVSYHPECYRRIKKM